MDGTLATSLRDEVSGGGPGADEAAGQWDRWIVMLTGDHRRSPRLSPTNWGLRVARRGHAGGQARGGAADDGYVVGWSATARPGAEAADIGTPWPFAGNRDAAAETADVALANDDLHRLLDAGDLGERSG